MNINKVNSVLKRVQKEQLNSNELFQVITVLNRQYIQQLVGETVLRIVDNNKEIKVQ